MLTLLPLPSSNIFFLPAGDDITSKQLRDDLMTLLIAGHETTAAVLTWTFHCVVDRPEIISRMRQEVGAWLAEWWGWEGAGGAAASSHLTAWWRRIPPSHCCLGPRA